MNRNFKVDLPIVAERYEGDIMVDEDIIIDFVCPMSREEVDAAIYKAEYLGEFVLLS